MRQGTETAAPASGGTPEAVYVVLASLALARRRWGLIAGSATALALAAACVALLQPPVYRATAELLVDPQGLQVVGRDIVRSDASASLDLAGVDSQSLVLVSTPVLRQVVERLGLADDPAFQLRPGWLARHFDPPAPRGAPERTADALEILKRAVAIRRVESSLVLQITASDREAARAAAIANALGEAYLRQVARERVDSVQRADGSLIGQVATLRGQLDAAEAEVERFRTRNGLIRSSDTGLVVTQQLKDLYTQIDAAGAELSRLTARRAQLARIGSDTALSDTIPEALASPTVASLRAQYATTAREIASLGRTLMPGHPRMAELGAERTETLTLLKAELGRIRASIGQSYDQAKANLANLQARAAELTRSKVSSSEAEIRLRQLESEAEAIRAVFNASLTRARELEQQGRIETGNSRILTDATAPARPANLPLPLVMAMGALFGACLGLGLAYLVEVLPRRARGPALTAQAAARLLGTDLVVGVPATRWRRTAVPASAMDPVARALRRGLGGRLPAVVAVAALPEGGPAGDVAEALGAALAGLGEHVLLCDRDGTAGPMAVRRLSSGDARGGEFVVTAAGQAAEADAVVVAVDLARADPAALAAAARAFGRRAVALVALGAEAGSIAPVPRPALDRAS